MLERKESFELTAARARILFQGIKQGLILQAKNLTGRIEKLEWFEKPNPDQRSMESDIMLRIYDGVEGNLNHIQNEFQELKQLKLRINAMEKRRDENEGQGS